MSSAFAVTVHQRLTLLFAAASDSPRKHPQDELILFHLFPLTADESRHNATPQAQDERELVPRSVVQSDTLTERRRVDQERDELAGELRWYARPVSYYAR